jgi:RNA polymerase sigma-70 factor (ECF subfamily)
MSGTPVSGRERLDAVRPGRLPARDMSTAPPLDDDPQLVARAREGEVQAFEALVERYRDRVYGLALRLLRTEADAAEVTQETFLAAWQSLKDFRGDAAFGTWLQRIAANRALMTLRTRKVRQAAREQLEGPGFSQTGELIEMPAPRWARRADERVLERELGRAIQEATDALPEGYREVFLLKDVEGLSYEAIGELTDSSVGAVKSRLHRARLALRERIDQYYREASS